LNTSVTDSGARAAAGAGPVPSGTFYWTVRRELWEHRWLFITPLAAAAVLLLGFVISLFLRLPAALASGAPVAVREFLVLPFYFSADALMLVFMLVALLYCLEALHGERRDRSILFWKSLPVSDLTTVLAKASLPLALLPLLFFAITIALHLLMLLLGGAVLAADGVSIATFWAAVPLLTMWLALLWHLATVHALYPAPIYGWLLLVSAWARRATFLWAVLPPLAVALLERVVYGTHHFAAALGSRLAGGPAALPFPSSGAMVLHPVTLEALGRFFATPGLWFGLAVLAAFLGAAVRVRRFHGPI
jgi:ABC-2 type transport system permease protein